MTQTVTHCILGRDIITLKHCKKQYTQLHIRPTDGNEFQLCERNISTREWQRPIVSSLRTQQARHT